MKIKSLLIIKKKQSGRDNQGHVSVRHRGGEHRRFIRLLDWKRNEQNVTGQVMSIDYDPGRTSAIAQINYENGLKSYILATTNLRVGDSVITADNAPIKDGNRLCLKNIPVGIPIHAIELLPNHMGQIVKSAGSAAYIQSIDGDKATIKLPSGELRLFHSGCKATIGQVSNSQHNTIKLVKAGDSRHRGIRPGVRGVAQNPHSHPHGGGEGKSSIGMNPKTPWGKPAMGKRTRSLKKRSTKLIIKRRK